MKAKRISWPAFPFSTDSLDFGPEGPPDPKPLRDGGSFLIAGDVSDNPAICGWSMQTITPDPEELAILNRCYPQADPRWPVWKQVEADLIAQGVALDTIRKLTSSQAIRTLKRAGETDNGDDTLSDRARDTDQQFARLAQAVGDHNAVEILAIAQQTNISGPDKLEAIAKIDPRYKGKRSAELGILIGVTDGAVRGYPIWKQWQLEQTSLS